MTTPKTARALYSRTWLAQYGQGLKRDEIRLVQAYRGLPREKQAAVRTVLASMIMTGAEIRDAVSRLDARDEKGGA
jgi:hypothetical protein